MRDPRLSHFRTFRIDDSMLKLPTAPADFTPLIEGFYPTGRGVTPSQRWEPRGVGLVGTHLIVVGLSAQNYWRCLKPPLINLRQVRFDTTTSLLD